MDGRGALTMSVQVSSVQGLLALIGSVVVAWLLPVLRLLCLLGIGRRDRIAAKRQHAAELACGAANAAAQARIAKDAADGTAERLADLANQVAEPALRIDLALLRERLCQLGILDLLLLQLVLELLDLLLQLLLLLWALGNHSLVSSKWQQAAQLAGRAADGAAQARIAEDAANGATERLAYLADQVAEPALRSQLLLLLLLCQLRQLSLLSLLGIGGGQWIGREWQHAAELAGSAANCATDARLAKNAADGAAKRLADLANQVAKPALRRHLLAHLCLLRELLLQLLLLQLLELLLLCLLSIGSGDGVGAEWQDRAAQAAGHLADLLAEVGAAEQAADPLANQAAQWGANQTAEKPLWCELLTISILLKFIHDFLHM
jgi:hypothetical protein